MPRPHYPSRVDLLHDAASDGYLAARSELLLAEQELRDTTEAVAAKRRALPPGPPVDPATPLTTAAGKPVTLGALLGRHRTLLTYNLMYAADWIQPCPMCCMWVDSIDALAPHLTDRTAVAVMAPASPGQLAAVAKRRGWQWIQVVSTQPGELTAQLGLARPGGGLEPAVTSYAKDGHGVLRVHWHGTADLRDPGDRNAEPYQGADGEDPRGVDQYCATWPLLDLLPGGRGDWYAHRQTREPGTTATR